MEDAALVEVLHRAYGLPVARLAYLKRAWVAHCYAVEGASGGRFFLKDYPDGRQARSYARDLDFYLSVTHDLYTRQGLPVACPVPALDGRYALPFDGHLLILFGWIEGQVVGFDRFSDDVLAQVATLVGTIHRSTPTIAWPDPPREGFDLRFERDLVRGLDALSEVTPASTPGQQALRKLLWPRRDEILGLLDRLKALQAQVHARLRAREVEMALCHTDLHGGNMIRDEAGQLYLLDWEGAMLAPPEHDLFFFAWEERFWDRFLPRYERAFGPVRLESETFGFYFYRRNLEDLAEWIVRILYEGNGEAQDREDLEGIAEDCIAGWPYLERTIAQIEGKLRALGR